MRREIRRFLERNGGEEQAFGVGQLLVQWDRAARQIARWRAEQALAYGPSWAEPWKKKAGGPRPEIRSAVIHQQRCRHCNSLIPTH